MSLVDQILFEALPNTLRQLKVKLDHKDIDVNSIFKNKFNIKYRREYNKREEQYYKTKSDKVYGGDFMRTGMEVMNVSVNDIYPGQPGVETKGLELTLAGTGHSPRTEYPEAIRLYNEGNPIIMLVDGHHRVAAEILNGATHIKLIVKVKDFMR